MPTASQDSRERLSGVVERVTYHSEASGFAVLRVKVPGRPALETVVGRVPAVSAGEGVEARGRWIVDRRHGRQFEAEDIRTVSPASEEGLRRYLASGMVPGIGPSYAERLVNAFGRDVLRVIEEEPRRLLQVQGIGRKRLERIRRAWREQKASRDLLVFLHDHGVGTSRALRIHRAYGEKAEERIRRDPYCLARDVRGIGFRTADALAARLGVDPSSDLRARAGVEHVLLRFTDEGHCACPRPELVSRAVRELAIPAPALERAVDRGLADRRLVQTSDTDPPLVYLAHLHAAETGLARRLAALARGRHPLPGTDPGRVLQWVAGALGLRLGRDQAEALRLALSHKLLVVTGGPGTGKTTLVQALVRVMERGKLSVVLAAPTGRAARRLAEASGRDARTIHRLLGFDPAQGRFRHDERKPLAGDVFVVDEVSMVDLPLAASLARALPDRAALVLVGDADQLPSVGPGTVLRDVIASGAVASVRLREIFRQAARSLIVRSAHRIQQGLDPLSPLRRGGEGDFFFFEEDDPERASELLVSLVAERIPRRFGLDPRADIQVLAPMRKGALGTRHLNAALQERLNPGAGGVERFGWTYREGDRVMQTVNDYEKEVFNGDVGRIASVDETAGEVAVAFEGRAVRYAFGDLDELSLAYAATVHKSQGSEYPCVVLAVHGQHHILLRRNLLYTAVTRARRLAVLVGQRRAVAQAARRADARERLSRLRQRLAEELGQPSDALPGLFPPAS